MSRYTSPESVVFYHEALGTPLDPSKLSGFGRKALKAAGIETFRVWHGLRHTALTETAPAGIPHRTAFREAAELAEARLFTQSPSP